jgi:hypothetical protein
MVVQRRAASPAFLQQCRFTTMEGYPSQILAIITRQLATALKL